MNKMQDWQLRLRPLSTGWEGVDPPMRMKRLLKAALRSYGFRCIALDIPTPLPPLPPEFDPERTAPPFVSPSTPSPDAISRQQMTDESSSGAESIVDDSERLKNELSNDDN